MDAAECKGQPRQATQSWMINANKRKLIRIACYAMMAFFSIWSIPTQIQTFCCFTLALYIREVSDEQVVLFKYASKLIGVEDGAGLSLLPSTRLAIRSCSLSSCSFPPAAATWMLSSFPSRANGSSREGQQEPEQKQFFPSLSLSLSLSLSSCPLNADVVCCD